MALAITPRPPSSAPRPTATAPPSVTLAAYLATVAGAVRAGMPAQSWIEATVAAVKASSFGCSLQLVDAAGGPSAPTMRAFLRTADRDAIARRLGTPFDPSHLVGMTAVLLIEPEFSPRWGLGGRVVGVSEALRDSLMRRALEEVRARLKSEGLYSRQLRLPAPADVLRVTVVHPAGAAGHADIAGELARWQRAGIVAVTSVTAAFEGPRAAAELVAALRRAGSGDGAPPDVVLMVRGGGDRAGLLALDDEAVARAVCLCAVPVIAGLGHAVDRSLVDEVSAITADTPSKALHRLARLIAGPARRARADMAAVMVEAERRTAAAGQVIDAARHGLLAGAERRLAAGAAALAAARAGVATGTAGAGERCARLGAEAARLLEAVRERAPLRLDEAGRLAGRLAGDGMAGGRRRLEQADGGRALIGAALTRAGARLDAAALDARRRRDTLTMDVARRLTDGGVDLARLAGTVESLGLDATLRRGFALATQPDGTLVPTRAAARAAGDIALHFADGAVLARVGADLTTMTTTTNITGEAA